MKLLRFVIINSLTTLIFISCSTEKVDITNLDDSDNEVLEAYEELNISYGADINQKFDLYLPANRTASTKTIILVHGGGWTSGDKSSMNVFKDLLIQEIPDVAIANVNYRLADATNQAYPMQIDDISSVIQFLKDNKAKYSISDKIGFIGTSAGGHLSLLWSYAFDVANNVNMVCSIVGPTNFTDPAYTNNTNTALQLLISLYGLNLTTEYLEEISPYHQVTEDSPSTILFYGGQDPLVPTSQGTDLRDKLVSLNVNHEFTLYPNEGHGWEGINLSDTWTKLKVFIINNL